MTEDSIGGKKNKMDYQEACCSRAGPSSSYESPNGYSAADRSGKRAVIGKGPLGGGVSRRRLLNWFLNTAMGAFVASVLYPVARYLVPPKVEESSARTVTLSVKPGEVKPNSGQIFKLGSQPGILIRTPANELRAFSAICTHLACIVQYRSDLAHIWCACHNGHYDLNGKNIAGPPPRPLEQYSVNVRGDQIVISKAA